MLADPRNAKLFADFLGGISAAITDADQLNPNLRFQIRNMAASCISAGPNNANADRGHCRHDLPCRTPRRRLEMTQSLRWDNRIGQATDLLNPDFDHVARLEVLRRIH